MIPQNAWLWRSVGLTLESSRGLGEIETPLQKGTHNISHVLGPRAETVIWREPGLDLLSYLGISPREAGGNWSSPWGHRHWQKPFWGAHFTTWILVQEPFWNPPSSLLTSGPSSAPIQQSVGISSGTPQAKELTGCGHSPTHQQRGCLKTSWAHRHPWTLLCPPGGPGPSPTHQCTGSRTRTSRILQPGTWIHPLVRRLQPQNLKHHPQATLL